MCRLERGAPMSARSHQRPPTPRRVNSRFQRTADLDSSPIEVHNLADSRCLPAQLQVVAGPEDLQEKLGSVPSLEVGSRRERLVDQILGAGFTTGTLRTGDVLLGEQEELSLVIVTLGLSHLTPAPSFVPSVQQRYVLCQAESRRRCGTLHARSAHGGGPRVVPPVPGY